MSTRAAAQPSPPKDEWLLPTLEALLTEESVAQLRRAVRDSYWDTVVRRGLLTDDELLAALAARFRMKLADLTTVTNEARELVPEALARKYRILPLTVSDAALQIATADPHDLDCERTLAFATGRTVRMALASPLRIVERIDDIYRPENAVEKILEGVSGNYDIQELVDDDDEFDLSANKATERPIIRLVDHIIAEAVGTRASDVHVEAEEGGVGVKYRIDGVLRQVMTLPRAVGIPLVSRIKIMSGMDIADRLRPQDGRARVAVNGNKIELRVSTLPAAHGEKVVIRVLDARSTNLSLDTLGFSAHDAERLRQLLQMREGIILVTGPTGSGKTTTLYSALKQIQARGVNIVTVEDPVEYRMPGIVQVQVNEKAGLTFASALRSILRQDPDVVLVGEIRDRETAQIATQASLTGHLVLSTLHTIDAATSVTRLTDIGIESFKIAAALKGVIAQRLVRRLCLACRLPLSEPLAENVQRWIPAGTVLFRPVGCPECAQTGYRGRMAVTEVLVTNAEIERRISGRESAERVTQAGRESGMRSLWEAGIAHLCAGETSPDELLRVLEAPPQDGRRSASAPANAYPAAPASAPVEEVAARAGALPVTAARWSGSGVAEESANAAFQLVDDLLTSAEGETARRTVLLVEDEVPLRQVVRGLLEHDGFAVVEAGDGVEALDQVDRIAPDLVVLDLSLPRLDGFGVLSHLRSRQATASLPVLVLTAKGDEDSEVRVFEHGADDFLTKPFRPRALAARLRALLKRG